jgi:hypothetical protein
VQQPRRLSTPPPACNSFPLLNAFFSPGVDGCRPGVLQELSPRPPASPTTEVAGRVCRLVGIHHLPGSHTVSNPAPSWASIDRDGVCANVKPAVLTISRQEFLTLYEQYIFSSLRSRIIICHKASSHAVSISCRLSTPPVDAYTSAAGRRCQRQRKRAPTASVAGPTPLPPEPTPLPPPHDPPLQQSSPRHRLSGPEKPLGAGARLSCYVRPTLMTN